MLFKFILLMILGVLSLFFLLFTLFNDRPGPYFGGMNYMMIVTGTGIILCIAGLAWSFKEDKRRRK